jgi:DNA-binding LytR/AlgR family response regulator
MLRAAICDDNPEHRRELQNIVVNVLFEREEHCVDMFSDGVQILALIANNAFDYDLILLDIQMPQINGIQVARALRFNKLPAEIIFVTRHDEYVYDGYQYSAFSFLKKPVVTSLFARELNRFLDSRAEHADQFITIQQKGIIQRIDLRRVDYIESSKRKVCVVSGVDSIEYYAKLSEMEKSVKKHGLIRIHQSYLVNFNRCKRLLRNSVVLYNGKNIPVSKRYSQEITDLMATPATIVSRAQ